MTEYTGFPGVRVDSDGVVRSVRNITYTDLAIFAKQELLEAGFGHDPLLAQNVVELAMRTLAIGYATRNYQLADPIELVRGLIFVMFNKCL